MAIRESMQFPHSSVLIQQHARAMQVSHHPPIAAAHAENERWVYDIVSAPSTKFLGNSVDIYPVGASPVPKTHFVLVTASSGVLSEHRVQVSSHVDVTIILVVQAHVAHGIAGSLQATCSFVQSHMDPRRRTFSRTWGSPHQARRQAICIDAMAVVHVTVP